jgi:hypothetical protein
MRDQHPTSSSHGSFLDPARRLAPLLALVAIVGGLAYWQAASAARLEGKLDRVRADFLQFREATAAMQVDKGQFPYTQPGNRLPPSMTTPIPYMTTLPRDPFSPSGEFYRMVTQDAANHWTMHRTLFVSRGPDGDWDIDKLPRSERWAGMIRPNGMMSAKSSELEEPTAIWANSLPDAEYVLLEDGSRVEGTLIPDAIMLPTFRGNDVGVPMRANGIETSNYLVEHGVSPYDPTNGAYSDGDLVLSIPEAEYYEVEGVDLFAGHGRSRRP